MGLESLIKKQDYGVVKYASKIIIVTHALD